MREAVALGAREVMDAEISEEIGAGLGEVAPGARSTHRNGYPPRAWETSGGEIELLIPRNRRERRGWRKIAAGSADVTKHP